MPIQLEEFSASPALCWVAVGTFQSPEIWLNSLLPCSTVPWLYPDQLFDLLAPKGTMRRWDLAGVEAPAAAAGPAGDAATRAVMRGNRDTMAARRRVRMSEHFGALARFPGVAPECSRSFWGFHPNEGISQASD